MPRAKYGTRYARVVREVHGRGTFAAQWLALIQLARLTLNSLIARRRFSPVRILEIGCNTGDFLREVQRQYALPVIGLDINADALRQTARNGDVVVLADAQHVPVTAGSIDVIFCQHTLEHLADVPAALREIARILCSAGKAFVIVPQNWWGLETIRVAFESLPESLRSFLAAWRHARRLHCSPFGGPLGGARRHVQAILRQHKIPLHVTGCHRGLHG